MIGSGEREDHEIMKNTKFFSNPEKRFGGSLYTPVDVLDSKIRNKSDTEEHTRVFLQVIQRIGWGWAALKETVDCYRIFTRIRPPRV